VRSMVSARPCSATSSSSIRTTLSSW